MKNSEVIEAIAEDFPEKYRLTKADKRDIIKYVIEAYLKDMSDKLTSDEIFTLKRIGNLTPKKLKIGAKINPFTGLPIKEQIVTRVKFTPFTTLKKKMKG